MLKTKKSLFGILLCFVTVVCLTLGVTFTSTPNKAFASSNSITNGTAQNANGSITVDGSANEGTSVTVTVTPNECCVLKSLTYVHTLSAWSVIGGFGGDTWTKDIPMAEIESGVFVSPVLSLSAGDEFKVRKDGDWTENFGASDEASPYTVTLDTSFAVEGEGHNMTVQSAGNYVVTLNVNDNTITVTSASTSVADPVAITADQGGNYTFIMPAYDITIKATFKRCYAVTPYSFDFETDLIDEGWTNIDKDGDGQDWITGTQNYGDQGWGVDGSNCAISQSYENTTWTAYNADNWLFSPAITVPKGGAKVTWYEQSQDDDWPDSYMVYVGETISTEEYDASTNPTGMKQIYSGTAEKPWTQKTAELSAKDYGGKTVYIAFRHKSYDCFYLEIDNFAVEALHTHDIVKVNGKKATETEAGYKSYYKCTICDLCFEDEDGTTPIEDIETWKSTGNGYIPNHTHDLTLVSGKKATETEAGYKSYYKCTICDLYFEDENGEKEITNIESWKKGRGHIPSIKEFANTKEELKTSLEDVELQDPLTDKTVLENVKARIEKATTKAEVELAMLSAVSEIQKAQRAELDVAKANAIDALYSEVAKDSLADKTALTNAINSIYSATTKAEVESAKSSALTAVQSAQKDELATYKSNAKSSLDAEASKKSLSDSNVLTNGKANIDKATTKAEVERAKNSAITAIRDAQRSQNNSSNKSLLWLWIVVAVVVIGCVGTAGFFAKKVSKE